MDEKDVLPDVPDDVPLGEYTRYWLPSGVYDLCKWLSCLAVPAFGAFYVALASPLGLPCAEQVSAACLAFSTLLGTLIGASEATKKRVKL